MQRRKFILTKLKPGDVEVYYRKKLMSGFCGEFCHQFRRIILCTDKDVICRQQKLVPEFSKVCLDHVILHEVCHARVSKLKGTWKPNNNKIPPFNEEEFIANNFSCPVEEVLNQEYLAETKLRELCKEYGWDDILEYSTALQKKILEIHQNRWDMYGWYRGAERILEEEI